MSTNGQLLFTDVDKITFKGVGNTSNAVIDTLTGKIGVGIDNPEANLHVQGNSYVSTNLELGGTLIMGTVNVEAYHSLEAVTATGNTTPLTVEFSNATTGIVTTGNVQVGNELTVAGNATISSNLIVSGNVEVSNTLSFGSAVNMYMDMIGYVQRQKLTAGDGAGNDYFGYSVSIDGDTAVIGAYGDDDDGSTSGSAYVFTRTNGIWTQVAKLTAGDAAGADFFGHSVSIDGDTMVIGAYRDDDDGSDSGSAYVFTRDTVGDLTSGWTQVAKLTAGDAAGGDLFGWSVSIDGDTIVIGAYQEDDRGTNSGSAYVFTRDTAGNLTSSWTQRAKLTANDGAAYDYFGWSVSIDGDTAVIGAYGDDDDGTESGSAYIFTRDTAGNLTSGWTQAAKLTANDGAADDEFGYSVSIDGDTVVIGVCYDDHKGTNSGSAYVFTRDTAGNLASGWTQVAKLTADDGASYDFFGRSVSIDGEMMVIGADGGDDKGSNSGSAYVFTRNTAGDLTSGWTQVAKLTADDGSGGDRFGESVSIDGDTMVIGARLDDDDGTNSGSVYIFSTPVIKDITVLGDATVARELTVTGSATVSSNLTVSGNVEVARELTVTGSATISSNLTVSGNATVSSALTVNGHIHQEDGRWKFDFENRRPARLTPTTEFRYVVVQGTTDLPSSSQPNTKYVIPDSGTTVYQYTPSTDTTTTLISSTSSADTVGDIALTTGTEIFTTDAKPFVLSTPVYNYAVIPFACKGYYFGFTNQRYPPATIFLYAPYEDVTVNLYLNKSITETPTETFTLTKQTVVTRTINHSYDHYSYTIEAVNGVIMASRKGQDAGGATTPNGDHEILYPASNLGYNMTSSSGSYYNHDVFNTGGNSNDEGRFRFSSGVVQTGPTFYSPAGIPHFSSCGGDGDGGDTTGIIPHEIVGEIYYIPHIIPGYMIGFLTNRQTVTAQYYHGGQWYTENATTGPQYTVSAYNCIPVRRWAVGGKLDGGRSDLSGNMLTSTLWKFTSDHPFVLRVENDEQATQGLVSSGVNGWDEYMAVGWLNSARTTPIYKPPCALTPVMYKAALVTGINVNAGNQDVWTEYNVFSEQATTFNRAYGGGFSTYGTGTRIVVPAPGLYRCTATVYLNRTDINSTRTTTEMQFSHHNGTGTGPIGEAYIRLYEGHENASMSITHIVDLNHADWNSTSTDVLPHIGLLFRRAGTITEPVNISNGLVILELIR